MLRTLICLVPALPSLLVLFKNVDDCFFVDTVQRREELEHNTSDDDVSSGGWSG